MEEAAEGKEEAEGEEAAEQAAEEGEAAEKEEGPGSVGHGTGGKWAKEGIDE